MDEYCCDEVSMVSSEGNESADPSTLGTRLSVLAVVTAFFFIGTPAVAQAETDATPPPAGEQQTETQQQAQQGWWTPTYLIDYGLITAGIGTFAVGRSMDARSPALMGPSHDRTSEELLAERYESELGKDYLATSTFPLRWLAYSVVGGGVYLGVQESLAWALGDQGSAQHVHDTMVGFLESAALTAGTVDVIKVGTGRLRPDYQDRLRLHRCGEGTQSDQVDCSRYEGDEFAEAREDTEHVLSRGQKAFVSGHASQSFSLAGFMSLSVGGRFVWGDSATPVSRVAGIASQAALMGGAGWVSASRIQDGRHHLGDVVGGAAIGFGFANLAYWRRFGLDGQPRRGQADRDFTAEVRPMLGWGESETTGLELTVVY